MDEPEAVECSAVDGYEPFDSLCISLECVGIWCEPREIRINVVRDQCSLTVHPNLYSVRLLSVVACTEIPVE